MRDKNGELLILGTAITTNNEAFVRPTLGSDEDNKGNLAVQQGTSGGPKSIMHTEGAVTGNHPGVPLGQFYVVAASGTDEYKINGKAAPLQKGAFVEANGTTVKTGDKDGKLTLLFANQTALALGPNTEIDVQQFQQETFTPGGTPDGIEPSNSQSVYILRSGSVDVDTPQLLVGTHLTFETVHGTIGIMNGQTGGEKASLNVDDKRTDVVMTIGLARVHSRNADGTIGQEYELKTGDEAFVRPTVGAKPTLNAATAGPEPTPTPPWPWANSTCAVCPARPRSPSMARPPCSSRPTSCLRRPPV